MESAIESLADIFTSFLTVSVNMSTGGEMAERKKMSHGLEEIGKLNVNEECIIELK